MATILLVDDNLANRVLAMKLLRARGHEIVEAEDGEAAVALARERRPALVLLDLGLPGIDGWETLRRIRADEASRDLPVVAVTAHAMVGDRERAMAAGFDGYLSKPIDASTFGDTVSGFLLSASEER